MPVMKQFRIGSATYDTVGEASVTQVQTSGTKIATVTIDGTATDLYAPEGGGGGPEPSSTTPAMDGTAAVGTATTYARADHVHPTDTSRQATLVSGTNIKTVNSTSLLGSGNVEVQPTLVSGTNIKTINDESLLGSGNITIGGGGGGAGLVINVVVDGSGNVLSYDADTATCLDFAQAAVNNSDALAVAYVREYSYDDEDDIYNSYVYSLPLINAGTTSYGGGQYAADGGVRLTFGYARATIKGSAKMSIYARELEILTTNDDPEMPVSITYTYKSASSNS